MLCDLCSWQDWPQLLWCWWQYWNLDPCSRSCQRFCLYFFMLCPFVWTVIRHSQQILRVFKIFCAPVMDFIRDWAPAIDHFWNRAGHRHGEDLTWSCDVFLLTTVLLPVSAKIRSPKHVPKLTKFGKLVKKKSLKEEMTKFGSIAPPTDTQNTEVALAATRKVVETWDKKPCAGLIKTYISYTLKCTICITCLHLWLMRPLSVHISQTKCVYKNEEWTH